MRRVDSQVDGQVGNALVSSCQAVGIVLNFLADGVEILKDLALAVQKLAILCKKIQMFEMLNARKQNRVCVCTLGGIDQL